MDVLILSPETVAEIKAHAVLKEFKWTNVFAPLLGVYLLLSVFLGVAMGTYSTYRLQVVGISGVVLILMFLPTLLIFVRAEWLECQHRALGRLGIWWSSTHQVWVQDLVCPK